MNEESYWYEVTLKIKGRARSEEEAKKGIIRRISEYTGICLGAIKVVEVKKTTAPY